MLGWHAGWWCLAGVTACGGAVAPDVPDATLDATRTSDVVQLDDGARDADPPDSPADAGCSPFATKSCDGGCAAGTVCVWQNPCAGGLVSDPPYELGCLPIPTSCAGTPSCDCLAACFCADCYEDTKYGLRCPSGCVSRRAFKKDIEYLDDAERERLAQEALSIPLATYRYKTEPESDKKHLGFIIDDQPEGSPAVQADETHVDEYGSPSMRLATVQEQKKAIDALTKRVDAAERRCKGHP